MAGVRRGFNGPGSRRVRRSAATQRRRVRHTRRIVTPVGAAILPQGAKPQIHFEIVDDFGLAAVEVQLLETGKDGTITAKTIDAFDPKTSPAYNKIWNADLTATPGK